ncbi:MAG: RluA family pseudouridine synthase [Myxococcota bacterium]|nr:RluA family pseudouridine synthase [Myxococcota bacterium]
MAEPSQQYIVSEEDAGERLDSLLSLLADVSRSQVRRWIEEGRVRVGDAPARASLRVRAGDRIDASPPEALPSPLEPEAIPLVILFEDVDLIVIDKPAGMVVHPAPGHPGGTLVNALLHHCGDLAGVGGVTRPGIVHRLDQGTSGVMVAAKNDAAHRGLAEQFQDHSIEREYRALVRGVPGPDEGRIDRAVGRHRRDRKRMSVNVDAGREAVTVWRVLARFVRSDRSWLSVHPETGRTHQIRVHLASVGLPIAGDPVYGRARRAAGRGPDTGRGPDRGLGRPALHAAVLGFRHPRSGERVRFEAPLPADLAALLARLEELESTG